MRGDGLRRAGAFEAVALPSLGIAAASALFEIAPRVGLLPRSSFPTTGAVAGALAGLVGTAELWDAVGRTLSAWAWAMVGAVLVAVPLGVAMGASRLAGLVLRFTVEFLRPVPSVALVPVLVLVYGTDSSLTVALGVIAAAFPLLFQVMYGVADVDPVAQDMARAYGLGRFERLRWITLPSCAPYVATGLRISASVALILVVTGEYVVGVPGVGREVLVAQSGGAYDEAYAWIVVTGLLGLLVNLAFGAVERRYLAWHPSQRRTAAGEL